MCAKVYNKKTDKIPEGAVYIGRPSKWGNPFPITERCSREDSVKKFELLLLSSNKLQMDLHELRGKDLVCFCAPQPCHGDILLKYANALECPECLSTQIACHWNGIHKDKLLPGSATQQRNGDWINDQDGTIVSICELGEENCFFVCINCNHQIERDSIPEATRELFQI